MILFDGTFFVRELKKLETETEIALNSPNDPVTRCLGWFLPRDIEQRSNFNILRRQNPSNFLVNSRDTPGEVDPMDHIPLTEL